MSALLPYLYSFRRCPYAMRARLGLCFAGIQVELREVVLKNKPAQLLAISPKGTVPVLQLTADQGAQVLEESLDIIHWALAQNDPQGLLQEDREAADVLIARNDHEFKYWLDRYKYAERYPELSQVEYRAQGEQFLQALEALLGQHRYLLGDNISVADICIMPFVRQFAHVDRNMFYQLPYPRLQAWLDDWLERPVFQQVMQSFKSWQDGDLPQLFPH